MKLHLTKAADQNIFTGYGEGYVAINNQRFEHNVLVMPGRDITRWDPAGFDALAIADFSALLALQPEIVILGTGDTLRFPKPELTRPLAAAHVGFEAMDTKAACRTYNVLVAEGRQVVAAILV
ncbi:MAG TPA: Mth938-like domain-containing protein [Burkholderiales bacterium]|nr:Mth938-like domain-containing protein [Burkholderiales bacterium]